MIAAQEDLEVADLALGDRHRLGDRRVFLPGFLEQRRVGRRVPRRTSGSVLPLTRAIVVPVDDLLEIFQRMPAEGRPGPSCSTSESTRCESIVCVLLKIPAMA